MFQRIALILTLLVGLLFVTQAAPVRLERPVEHEGMCLGMQCATGCCASMECCRIAKETNSPETPSPGVPHIEAPLATIDLQIFTFVYRPPAASRSFTIARQAEIPHLLSPRAVSCIRLI